LNPVDLDKAILTAYRQLHHRFGDKLQLSNFMTDVSDIRNIVGCEYHTSPMGIETIPLQSRLTTVSQPSSGNINQVLIINTPNSSLLSSYNIEVITLDSSPFKVQQIEPRPSITTSNRFSALSYTQCNESDMFSGLPLVQDQPSAPFTQDSQCRPIKKIKWVPPKQVITTKHREIEPITELQLPVSKTSHYITSEGSKLLFTPLNTAMENPVEHFQTAKQLSQFGYLNTWK